MYELICNDRVYSTLDFESLREARCWLYEHARNQLSVQSDLRNPRDVGHDINLKKTETFELADYFDFTLNKKEV